MEFGTRERWGAGIVVAVVTLGSIGAWMNQRPGVVANNLTAPTASVDASESAATPKAMEFNAGEEPPTPAPPAETPPIASSPTPSPTPVAQLVVHVSGAVKKPGVYTFKPGDRIYHAIRAAGGLKPNADPDALNQAEYLRDADNIYFPVKRPPVAPVPASPAHALITRGTSPTAAAKPALPEPPRGRVLGKESPPVAVVGASSAEGGAGESPESGSSKKSDKLRTPGEGTVNINTAEAAELQRLPGVGPAMSQRILDYRQQIGKFNSPEQLRDVS